MQWLLWFMLFVSVVLLALWYLLQLYQNRSVRALQRAADERLRYVELVPPAPFDRLLADPQDAPLMPMLVCEHGGATYYLWCEPEVRWAGGAVVILTTAPHDRAYRDTTFMMGLHWEPAADDKTIRKVTDLVRRLYLEGRELHPGMTWQGYQLLSTQPSVVEARLPDDLPRTDADREYEYLTRILLLYRHTILLFAPTEDPQHLRGYMTLATGLAPALNAHLGPPPNPFQPAATA